MAPLFVSSSLASSPGKSASQGCSASGRADVGQPSGWPLFLKSRLRQLLANFVEQLVGQKRLGALSHRWPVPRGSTLAIARPVTGTKNITMAVSVSSVGHGRETHPPHHHKGEPKNAKQYDQADIDAAFHRLAHERSRGRCLTRALPALSRKHRPLSASGIPRTGLSEQRRGMPKVRVA